MAALRLSPAVPSPSPPGGGDFPCPQAGQDLVGPFLSGRGRLPQRLPSGLAAHPAAVAPGALPAHATGATGAPHGIPAAGSYCFLAAGFFAGAFLAAAAFAAGFLAAGFLAAAFFAGFAFGGLPSRIAW